MKPPRLSDSLRFARKSRRLSQKIVADEIGVPRTAISQIENGNRKVSSHELSKLARLYRQSIQDLVNETPPHENVDPLVVLQQIEPDLQRESDVWVQVTECLSLCKEGSRLRHLMGIYPGSSLPDYAATYPCSLGEAVFQAENVAEQERRRIGLGNAPVADIAAVIAQQGIWVSSVKLPRDISGFFVVHSDIDKLISVNSTYTGSRKHFAFAHEYAHLLLDRDKEVAVSTSNNSDELIECRANAFAAGLLMPRFGVVEMLQRLNKGYSSRSKRTVYDVAGSTHIDCQIRTPSGSQRIGYNDVATLAHHFGVSYQVAVLRLKSLRHVSTSESSKLLKQEKSAYEYLVELDMFDDLDGHEEQKRSDRSLRSEITNLAIEAYRREEVSRGRLLDLASSLSISGQVLLGLAEAARDA